MEKELKDVKDVKDVEMKEAPPIPTGPPVNTDAIDKKVWLVKVPRFVAEKWAEIQEEGVELGRVRIYNK